METNNQKDFRVTVWNKVTGHESAVGFKIQAYNLDDAAWLISDVAKGIQNGREADCISFNQNRTSCDIEYGKGKTPEVKIKVTDCEADRAIREKIRAKQNQTAERQAKHCLDSNLTPLEFGGSAERKLDGMIQAGINVAALGIGFAIGAKIIKALRKK